MRITPERTVFRFRRPTHNKVTIVVRIAAASHVLSAGVLCGGRV